MILLKEAIGESQFTVLTIILIGTITATLSVIIPRIISRISDKSCCLQNNGIIENNDAGNRVCKIEYTVGKDEKKYLEYQMRGLDERICD